MYILPYTTYIYIYIGFYGNIDHGPRKRLMDELIISLHKYNITYIIQPSKLWQLNMYVYILFLSYSNFIFYPLTCAYFPLIFTYIFLLFSSYFSSNTIFNLAPRGFGRTSFRAAEIIQLGRIPVFLYDDIPWVPYIGRYISIYICIYIYIYIYIWVYILCIYNVIELYSLYIYYVYICNILCRYICYIMYIY